MTIKELREKLSEPWMRKHDNDIVAILCSERSVGGHAYEQVRTIGTGSEWDKGKVFLEGEQPVMHKELDRDNPVPALHITEKTVNIRPYFVCPNCHVRLRPSCDRYCPGCGQRISYEKAHEVYL